MKSMNGHTQVYLGSAMELPDGRLVVPQATDAGAMKVHLVSAEGNITITTDLVTVDVVAVVEGITGGSAGSPGTGGKSLADLDTRLATVQAAVGVGVAFTRVPFNAKADGDVLVAADADNVIYVHGCFVSCPAGGTVQLTDGTTAFYGPMDLPLGVSVQPSRNAAPFKTGAVNRPVKVAVTGGGTVNGWLLISKAAT